jgi:hypothetical protein
VNRWIKEPLLHFLLAGALLFGAHAWVTRDQPVDAKRTVRITGQEIAWLTEAWSRQWQRPPTTEELRGLVADYLRESLLALEARELGMDENDTVIRRRLAQKMEFLVQDTASVMEPDEAELRKLYEARRDAFQTPARVSFAQIFFKTETDAQAALARLPSPVMPDGDQTLLEREYDKFDEQALSSVFGREFAVKLLALAPGDWQGPVQSAYGFHLVRISDHEPSKPRPFEEVRGTVLTEWQRAEEMKAKQMYFDGLHKKYEVVVDESVKELIGELKTSSHE